MLLTKRRPDEWVSARQVNSSFSLPVIRTAGKHTLQSEQFGLGWTAQCVALIQVIGAKTKNPRLQACCNLYVLTGSTPIPPGTLSLSASIESMPEKVRKVKTLITDVRACIGTFILEEPAFQGKPSLVVEITVTFPNDVAPHIAVPNAILPDVASPDVSLPDTAPPDVVPNVLPPDVTLPYVDSPEVASSNVDPLEVTPPDIGTPEEPLPQIPRPDPAFTYWSRILKAMKSTLDNDGKLPIDLKFMVRTRISPRGRIGHPKAIFASSVLVEGYTPYLDKYMKTGATLVDLDSDGHEDTEWDAYDYDGDSDFDEDDGDDNVADTEDLDAAMTATTDSDFEAFEHDSRVADVQGPVRLGTVWHVKDTAYTTWKALLGYLYTQEISFAPLKSSGALRTATSKDACSPKSMYRLAVKAGLGSLKDLAFECICSQLTPSNIVDEVFSGCAHLPFSYPELLDMEVRYLVANFTDPVVYPRWEKKMEEVGRGACPQGASVVNRVMRLILLEREISDENSQTPAR